MESTVKPMIEFYGEKVYAVKPYSTHPDDHFLFLVIRDSFTTGGIVVSGYNSNDRGYFSSSQQFESLREAIQNFNERGAQASCQY